MKNIIIPALLLISVPALAAKETKLKDIKCSDVGKSAENITPQYLAVIDGYDKSGKKVDEEVDMGEIVSESKQVNEQCAKNKSAKIAAVRKDLQKTASAPTPKATLNPSTAKCEDFIALGEEIQPVAAFWVAGHNKAGKLKKGEVDEEFMERPIATLIQDCKTKPTASFYDRTKLWLRSMSRKKAWRC